MIWRKVFYKLLDKEHDVFSPGAYAGGAKGKYVVVKEGITDSFGSSREVGYTFIDIFIVVPLTRYSQLSEYRQEVIEDLKELNCLGKVAGISESYIDDEMGAHVQVVRYQILKRMGF